MNKPTKFITGMPAMLIIALVFGMMAVGCDQDSGGGGGGGSGSVKDAQLYQSNGISEYTGSGTVKIGYYADDSYDDVYVEVGTVTDGKLSFTLPSPVPDAYLSPFDEVEMPGVTISDPSAKSYSPNLYLFNGSGREIGSLSLEKTDGTTTHQVGYIYLDKACSLSGTSSYSRNGYTQHITVSISAHSGWNKLYQYYTQSGTTITGTMKSGGEPSDMKWVINSYNY